MLTLLSKPCTLVVPSQYFTYPSLRDCHSRPYRTHRGAPWPQQPRGAGTAAAPLGRTGKLKKGQAGFTQGRPASPVFPGGRLKPGATRPPGLPAPGDLRRGPAPMCLTGRSGPPRPRTPAACASRPPSSAQLGCLPGREKRAGPSPGSVPFRAGVRRAPSPFTALPRAGRCAAPTDLGAAACCSRSLSPPPPGLMRGPRCARGRAAGEEEPPLLLLLPPAEPLEPGGLARKREASGLPRPAARRAGAGRRPGPRVRLLSQTRSLSARAPRHHLGSNADIGAAQARKTHGGRGWGGAGRRTHCVPACNAGGGGRADGAAAPRYPPSETIEFPGPFFPAFFTRVARRWGAAAALVCLHA